MGSVTPERHDIDFGERLAWTPAAGTVEFFVWVKPPAAATEAMRWRRVAGWSLTTNAPLPLNDAPAGYSLALTAAEVVIPWGGPAGPVRRVR